MKNLKEKFQVHITKMREENITIFCKYHNISVDDQEEILTKLLEVGVERILHGSQYVKSFRYEKQSQFLEGWNCEFRYPFDKYHNPTKEWHRKVLCSSSSTEGNVKLIELDTEICKHCNEQGGRTKPHHPESKKLDHPSSKALASPTGMSSPESPKPYPKDRICVNCGEIFLAKKREHIKCLRCGNIVMGSDKKSQPKEE